jgi:REP element-mobilizing transposase RayT
MEAWLDRATHVAHLRDSQVAPMVMEAIQCRVQRGIWQMFEFVIMPNHIHLFFELLSGRLKEVLENFKTWTGRQAGKHIKLGGGRFWQREWFDHWSRSDAEDDRIVAYIRKNPEKAGLVPDYRQWPYGSWVGPAGPAGQSCEQT